MIQFQIVTPWVLSETNGKSMLLPQVAKDYKLTSWVDVTGQSATHLVPSPNSFVIQALVDDVVYAQIEVDQNFFILWSQEA